MAEYICGPSGLSLPNRPAILPDERFEYDFSETGPEGEHGPSREAALIASGAIARTDRRWTPSKDSGLGPVGQKE